MEERLMGKRNSLTSADRDSGNGDSLDVATVSQPCTLPPGTRLFTFSTQTTQPANRTCNSSPFASYNQQIKSANVYNGCSDSTDNYIALELRPTPIGENAPLYRVRESSTNSRLAHNSSKVDQPATPEKLTTTFV